LYVPPDATGKTIHVVCEVRDDGNPPLVSYRRVICTVRDERGGRVTWHSRAYVWAALAP
jgi:hypothetical protein